MSGRLAERDVSSEKAAPVFRISARALRDTVARSCVVGLRSSLRRGSGKTGAISHRGREARQRRSARDPRPR